MRVGIAYERELMRRFHARPFTPWELAVRRMIAKSRRDLTMVWSFPVCLHEAKNFHAQLHAAGEPKPPINAHLQTYDKESVVDSSPLQLSEECWNYLAAGGDQYAHNELPVLGSNQKIRLVGDEWEASDEE